MRSLASATPAFTSAGRPCSSSTICVASSWPKAIVNATPARIVPPMTRPVAIPRRMRRARRDTAGSIAIDANQAMSRVKMTVPASSRTKRRNSAEATSPMATQPTCQMLRGSRRTGFGRSRCCDVTPAG